MGQSSSEVAGDRNLSELVHQRKAVAKAVSPTQIYSLKENVALISSGETKLNDLLGIQGFRGAEIMTKMARNLAFGNLKANLLVAIGWFNGELASALGEDSLALRRRLFDAACSTEIGVEAFLPFGDICSLMQLLVSAYNWDPEDFSRTSIEPISMQLINQMLSDFKTPAMRFGQFNDLIERYPGVLLSLANIWNRLLYSRNTVENSKPALTEHLSIDWEQLALLTIISVPQVLRAFPLYRGSTKGFSMRALEDCVSKWPTTSILMVQGKSPKDQHASWNSKNLDIDRILVLDHDTSVRQGKLVQVAVIIRDPWASSKKKCFGGAGCQIILLKPELCVFELEHDQIFLTPSIGFGAGFPTPPTIQERTKGSKLLVDSTMEHAVFQHVCPRTGQTFAYRFLVKEVEIVGLGDQKDLDWQQNAWAYEEKQSERREAYSTLKVTGIF